MSKEKHKVCLKKKKQVYIAYMLIYIILLSNKNSFISENEIESANHEIWDALS